MFWEFVFIILGFGLLMGGAELLIRGSTRIALSLGVSTLIVGLTVVAFGTSAPELFVSVSAAYSGTADVAVGNIIGSNIFNILIIVGLSALIRPIEIPRAVIVREMPIMLFVMALFYSLSLDGMISRLEGVVLFAGIIFYLILNYFLAKKHKAAIKLEMDQSEIETATKSRVVINLTFIVLGLLSMVLGAEWIVDNAKIIAKYYNISDLVIGITVVAIGTSLPELATTIVAARRGHAELAVGNGIGSNIFNVLCVIGLTASILPLRVNPKAISFDFPYMFLGCLAVWPLMRFGKNLSRWEGLLMLLAYVVYIVILALGRSNG
jgi:cation:H+ antiporter